MYKIIHFMREYHVEVHRSKGKGRGKQPKWEIRHKPAVRRIWVEV